MMIHFIRLKDVSLGEHAAFIPIKAEEFIKLHLKSKPDENPAEYRSRLRRCIAAALAGARCDCGEPI